MINRSIGFQYFNSSYTPKFKQERTDYLETIDKKFKNEFFPDLIVDVSRVDGYLTGNVFINELESPSTIGTICNFLLSKDRKYIPIGVSCTDKKDFEIISGMLKENHGDVYKLTKGFLCIPALFGQREIKRI